MANYVRFYLYEKSTNLLEYYKGKGVLVDDKSPSSYMTKERDNVQLKLYVRYEDKVDIWGKFNGHRLLCHIECPINPMPVKGEFEVPSINAINAFLLKNGWEQRCVCIIK